MNTQKVYFLLLLLYACYKIKYTIFDFIACFYYYFILCKVGIVVLEVKFLLKI